LTIFQQDALLYSPGAKFSYSSYGWNLISAVIEGASGQSFLNYMDEHVFKPIDMSQTVADHIDSIIVGRGRYYHVREGVLLNAPPIGVINSKQIMQHKWSYLLDSFLPRSV